LRINLRAEIAGLHAQVVCVLREHDAAVPAGEERPSADMAAAAGRRQELVVGGDRHGDHGLLMAFERPGTKNPTIACKLEIGNPNTFASSVLPSRV